LAGWTNCKGTAGDEQDEEAGGGAKSLETRRKRNQPLNNEHPPIESQQKSHPSIF